MKEQFFSKIKGQLQGQPIPPPEKAWENIEAALDIKKSSSFILWRRWMSIAAALLLPISFVAIVLWLQTEEKIIYTESPKTEKNDNLPSKNTEQQTTENTIIATNNVEKEMSRKHTAKQQLKSTEESKHIQKNISGNNSPQKTNIHSTKKETEQINQSTPKKDEKTTASTPIKDSFSTPLFKEDKEIFADSENKKIKIEVSPYTGISSFMPLTDANLIASEMNQFDSKNKAATTYGSNISIKISPKLHIRSGIGIINIEQETYNIPLTTFSENMEENFNMTSTSILKIDFTKKDALSSPSLELAYIRSIEETFSYELQFIEIPIEIEYQFLQSQKFGMASTTGLSTLLRNKNNIYINGNQQFAESTNINKTSFSANVGLKLKYNLNQNLSFNVEPQIKYFLNTITDNDNVKPYTIGINIGFSWKLFKE